MCFCYLLEVAVACDYVSIDVVSYKDVGCLGLRVLLALGG